MQQIIVEEGSFMYRWFAWSLKVIETWNVDDKQPNSKYLNGTSLCHMMRVILLLAPMALLIECGIICLLVFSFIIFPVRMLGTGTWALGTFARLVALAVVELVIWIARRPRIKLPDAVSRPYTFTSLLVASLVAQKQKICPLVTFSKKAS